MAVKAASLKYCLPKGIPIIVIHNITPEMIQETKPSQPKKISHKILLTGCLLKFVVTFFPKGAKINFANLKHCFASGIPIIVMYNINPNKK